MSKWVAGARPRTLGAAVVPVVVGTAAAHEFDPVRSALLLVVALGLQVGVNYLNDYTDGVRGVDTAARVGPTRLVASRLASPRAVAAAAVLAFAVASAAGVALAVTVDLRLLGVGALALLAAAAYSGVYARRGLGEVSVFVFFGVVAVAGSAYVQAGSIPDAAWWAAVPVGLLAVAILVANNLRDIPTDAAAGKRTLAVRMGDARTRDLYRLLVLSSFAFPVLGAVAGDLPPAALATLAAAFAARRPLRAIATARGPRLVAVLLGTARLHLTFGVLFTAGLLWR